MVLITLMAIRGCGACSRPAGAGMVLCMGCGDRTADRLHAVDDLLADLAVTAARWDVLTVSAGRGGEQGLPFQEAASAAAASMRSVVLFWAQQVAILRASPWQLPNSLGEVARWLMWRLDWLRAMESAPEAYAQIERAVSRGRAAIDKPTHRTSFPVGPCPEVYETRYCSGDVWAYVPLRVGEVPAVLRCRAPDCLRHAQPWLPQSWARAGERILRRKQLVKRSHGVHIGRGALDRGSAAHHQGVDS